MTDEWRKETDKLHERINEVKDGVAELKTDITRELAINGTKIDALREDIKNGQAMKAVDKRGLFAIIVATIASATALVRSFW